MSGRGSNLHPIAPGAPIPSAKVGGTLSIFKEEIIPILSKLRKQRKRNYFFFLFGCTCGMWKFPGQGSNPRHSSDLGQYSDNTRSLTQCTTRELLLFFFVFLGQYYMEVPRLGVKSELQLLAYTTTTTMPDQSHVCNLHHSSRQ